MNMPITFVDPGEVVEQTVSFQSGAYCLKGQVFHPRGRPSAIVVLNGATGVPARFYRHFARWLADEKGMACLTYDYRDFGASASGSLRRSNATMSDWGVHDAQAARDFAARRFTGIPLWVIGHSLGALCLPFQKNLDGIDRVIAVGSGPVHVRDHPWPYQALARLFWFGPVPWIAKLAGYLPGRALRFGPDLPGGVYAQWRRWCTTRSFFANDFGAALPFPDWAGVTAPVKVVAMADDDLVPPAVVWRLMQFFPESYRSQLVLRPQDYGVNRLGHIDVFAKDSKAAWDALVA